MEQRATELASAEPRDQAHASRAWSMAAAQMERNDREFTKGDLVAIFARLRGLAIDSDATARLFDLTVPELRASIRLSVLSDRPGGPLGPLAVALAAPLPEAPLLRSPNSLTPSRDTPPLPFSVLPLLPSSATAPPREDARTRPTAGAGASYEQGCKGGDDQDSAEDPCDAPTHALEKRT